MKFLVTIPPVIAKSLIGGYIEVESESYYEAILVAIHPTVWTEDNREYLDRFYAEQGKEPQ